MRALPARGACHGCTTISSDCLRSLSLIAGFVFWEPYSTAPPHDHSSVTTR